MTSNIPKYEKRYREGQDVCGPPFPRFVAFFENLGRQGCRVLHMLAGADQMAVLEKACRHTQPAGFILIADTPKNQASLAAFFADRPEAWAERVAAKGTLVFQKRGADNRAKECNA